MKGFRECVTTPWLKKYIDCLKETDAHASYAFFVIVTFVAACLSRRLYIDRSGYALWPNMYTVLYGPSGTGKGASMTPALHILQHQWMKHAGSLKVIPGDVTNEVLIDTIHQRNEQGIDGSILIITEEIGTLAGQQQYKAGLIDSLTQWYSCPDIGVGRYTIKSGEQELMGLYPNIIVNGTPETFSNLRKDVVTQGFLPRHILVNEARRKQNIPWEWNIDNAKLKALSQEVGKNFSQLDTDDGQPLRLKAARGSKCYQYLNNLKRWSDGQVDATPIDQERAWYNRFVDHVLKVCASTQLIEGRDVTVMDEECLLQSIAVVQCITPGVLDAYEQIHATPYGSQLTKILKLVSEGQWAHVVMSLAVRKLHIEHEIAKKMVNSLLSTGHIKKEMKEMKDGREGLWLSAG